MAMQLFYIINVIVTFQLCIFALFLLTRRNASSRILGVFIFSEAVVFLNFIFLRNPLVMYPIPVSVQYFVAPFRTLWGPAFYFYLLSLTSKPVHLTKRAALGKNLYAVLRDKLKMGDHAVDILSLDKNQDRQTDRNPR